MNIDPNTGLPELPDGEFWRIEEDNHVEAPRLLLMRREETVSGVLRRRLVTDKRIDSKFLFIRAGEDSTTAIARAARELLEDRNRWSGERMILSRHYGDYPPKKLEATS